MTVICPRCHDERSREAWYTHGKYRCLSCGYSETTEQSTEATEKEAVYDSNCEPCPECSSCDVRASNIKDIAFSIHYVDDVADFTCNACGHTWHGQYGYKGLA